jgi:hypothetical protein
VQRRKQRCVRRSPVPAPERLEVEVLIHDHLGEILRQKLLVLLRRQLAVVTPQLAELLLRLRRELHHLRDDLTPGSLHAVE